MERIFGKNNQIHAGHVAFGLRNQLTNGLGLRGQILGGDDRGQLRLHHTEYHAIGRFV